MEFQTLIILISILFLIFLYIGISFKMMTNKTSLKSIIVVMFLLFFQSYIFMNLKYSNEDFYYLYSLWKETVFFSLLMFIFMKKDIFFDSIKDKFLRNYLVIIIALSLYGIVIGLSKGNSLFDTFLGARDIMLPMFFFYIFASLKTNYKSLKNINYALVTIFIIHTTYAVYLYSTFDGDLTKLWFYDIYSNVEKGTEFSSFNYVRGDNLRACGLFTSPIEYSLNLVLLLFVTLYYIFFEKNIASKVLFTLLSILFTIGIYTSQVRTGFIVLAMGLFVCFIVYKTNFKILYKKIISVLVPSSMAIGSFIYLSLNISEFLVDESALGRLKQYAQVYVLLSNSLFGYGFGNIGTKGEFAFDSNVIISILAFGWIGGFIYLGLYISILCSLINKVNLVISSKLESHFIILYLSLISYHVCGLYFFSFQYTIPGSINYFILMASGIMFRKLKQIEEEQNQIKCFVALH